VALRAEPQAAPLRVLVLDDDRDTADSLAMLLRLIGHEVHTCYDGPAALACAGDFRPQAAVLDLALPGIDGLEIARRLRQRPELTGLRLVALSGYGRDEDCRLCAAAGFDHHLLKPCTADELRQALEVASPRP
jgi:CheY-like chemotaxis protein